MLNRLISKADGRLRTGVIALGAAMLLGASAGVQAWDGGPDRFDGRHVEARQDRRELHHDRQARDYFDARARQAAYYGDYRAAHRYRWIAAHKEREVRWDRRDLARNHDRRW